MDLKELLKDIVAAYAGLKVGSVIEGQLEKFVGGMAGEYSSAVTAILTAALMKWAGEKFLPGYADLVAVAAAAEGARGLENVLTLKGIAAPYVPAEEKTLSPREERLRALGVM